jgi:hypothetical protein
VDMDKDMDMGMVVAMKMVVDLDVDLKLGHQGFQILDMETWTFKDSNIR